MKTFKQLQEDMSKLPKLPGLGGGGGGTDSITGKSSAKSLKKRVIDAGKMATVPARFLLNIKSKPDPTEKFADSRMTPKEKVTSAISDYKRKQKKVNEGVASLAVKSGSKLIPALMTGIGAAGTIMQAKRKSKGDEKLREIARQQGLDLTDPRQRMKAMSRSRTKSMKGKVNNPEGVYKRIKKKKEKDDIPEEAMAPTNSVGGGQIAGTVEAGDNPPVKKRKKTYAYGGRGSRKMWMNNK